MAESAGTGNFLAAMSESSRKRVSLARTQLGDAEIQARALDTPAPPRLRLSSRRFDLIAEVKFRSPAAGQLRVGSEEHVNARVAGYAEAGAAVVSVLTEPSHFDGSLSHLKTAVRALDGRIPAMRKDFLVDPYQVCEARLFGAGGVLLIVRIITDAEAAALIECAVRLRQFVLLETFDEADIVRACALVKKYSSTAELLVGVNCRDLQTLEVVPGRLEELVRGLPDNVPRVAESGVATAQDAGRIAIAGYDVALVGSALMNALEPLQLVRAMLSSARTERARRS
ncbi:MAG TPA: indole-3-glycerol-phosphate synthase [Steroidobacteraceae bacterium]|nr:indole-3-glycerol-phosphate synthase [Steroidobacteraceae bacterium]